MSNSLPPRCNVYQLRTINEKCLMTHRTAMHSRSVGPRRESVFKKRRLAKAGTHSSCPIGCRSTVPAPPELASVCITMVLIQFGNASTAGDARAFVSEWKAPPLCLPKRLGTYAPFSMRNRCFFVNPLVSLWRCCNFG